MTRASSMHEAQHSKPLLWTNPEGSGGERGYYDRRVQKDAALLDFCMEAGGYNPRNVGIL